MCQCPLLSRNHSQKCGNHPSCSVAQVISLSLSLPFFHTGKQWVIKKRPQRLFLHQHSVETPPFSPEGLYPESPVRLPHGAECRPTGDPTLLLGIYQTTRATAMVDGNSGPGVLSQCPSFTPRVTCSSLSEGWPSESVFKFCCCIESNKWFHPHVTLPGIFVNFPTE